MNTDNRPGSLWLFFILLLLLLPVWPVMVALDEAAVRAGNDFVGLLAKLFPLFAVGDVVCAWFVYRRDKCIFAILLSVLVAAYALCYWWSYLYTN